MNYRAKTGINFERDGSDVRVEPGDVVDYLPESAIPWLKEQGFIEETEEPVSTQADNKKKKSS